MADDGIRPGLRAYYATQKADAELGTRRQAQQQQSALLQAAPELARLAQSNDPESMKQAAAMLIQIKPELAEDPAIASLTKKFSAQTIVDDTGKMKVGAFDPTTGQIKDTGFQAGSKGSDKGRFQSKRLYNPETGQVEEFTFDTLNGTMSAGSNGQAGFAGQFRTNPATGEIIGLNPANVSAAPKVVPGTGAIPLSDAVPEEQQNPKMLYGSLNPVQKKSYASVRDDFFKDTEAERSAVTSAQSAISKLQSGKEIGGDILRAVQNEFARANGEKGVMTDKDVEPFGGRQSVAAQLERIARFKSTGQMPEKDREFMQKYAAAMAKAAESKLDTKSAPFASQLATQTSLTAEQGKKLLVGGMNFTDRPQSADEAILKLKGMDALDKENFYKNLPAKLQQEVKEKLAKSRKP
jgi:hypothetical protein